MFVEAPATDETPPWFAHSCLGQGLVAHATEQCRSFRMATLDLRSWLRQGSLIVHGPDKSLLLMTHLDSDHGPVGRPFRINMWIAPIELETVPSWIVPQRSRLDPMSLEP